MDETNPPPTSSVLRFSTDDLPERDRIPVWCEVFGREIVRTSFEPSPDIPLSHAATLRKLPGVSLGSARTTGFRSQRTREMISDGLDDVFLTMCADAPAYGAQFGREAEIAPNEGLFLTSSEPARFDHPAPGRLIIIGAPRAVIAPMVGDLDAVFGRRVPQSETLRLLAAYISELDNRTLTSPALSEAAGAHLTDLLAIAIGATRDAANEAKSRGVRAARLAAIRREIGRSFTDPEFSLTTLATRLGVTQRYVQMLLSSQGTSFVDEIVEHRLRRAHDMLSSARHAHMNITDIAYECGFSTVPHFHRTFRRRYGRTPSDIRQDAKR